MAGLDAELAGKRSISPSIKSPSDKLDNDKGNIYEETLNQYDPELVRRTWWKVDLHIMPIAVLLYLSAYIDRANIGNAKVLGLAESLHLSNGQYNWALSIFFVGYVIFETPSNIILKIVTPRYYIPSLTVRTSVISSPQDWT